MVAIESLREYRSFVEYRILAAMEKRRVEYRADITRIITEAVCDLGKHLNYTVTLEKRYQAPLAAERKLRSDVHWHGDVNHIWEIDTTIKMESAWKLSTAPEPEKMWVLWAKEEELISLRRMELTGINLMILSYDIRKLIWDRLLSEKFHRMELHNVLMQEERFLQAKKLDGKLAQGRSS